ncbi:MAG: hypothetical protein ACRDQB_16980 [Thermocrispum sp.]
MAVYVLTVDQRASRSTDDLVPDLLERLNRRPRGAGLLRRFERTAGDEVQGVLSSAEAVVEVVADLMRPAAWSIGVGMGAIAEPMPRSTRAGRGSAFVNARAAVDRAKSGPHLVNVVGDDDHRAEQGETVLWLLALLLKRRTEGGWEVADLVTAGLPRSEIAERLGISASAVSQRIQVAALAEERRARRLAVQLLDEEHS